MVQKLFGAVGIVGVLIIAGIALTKAGIFNGLAETAISAGILIGIALGILGVISVIKRLV